MIDPNSPIVEAAISAWYERPRLTTEDDRRAMAAALEAALAEHFRRAGGIPTNPIIASIVHIDAPKPEDHA